MFLVPVKTVSSTCVCRSVCLDPITASTTAPASGIKISNFQPKETDRETVVLSMADLISQSGQNAKVPKTRGTALAHGPRMAAVCPLHANKNSFVRNSLIVSRSLAACSNSNRLAASRISLSSFAM